MQGAYCDAEHLEPRTSSLRFLPRSPCHRRAVRPFPIWPRQREAGISAAACSSCTFLTVVYRPVSILHRPSTQKSTVSGAPPLPSSLSPKTPPLLLYSHRAYSHGGKL